MTTTAPRRDASPKRGWRAPAGLIMLGLIPVLAGAFRLTQLGSGAEITPDNERFFASPGPVVVHIVTVSVFAFLGAFQFAPRFRARRRGWHRVAGRLVVLCGLLGALSGLWMTLFYPRADNVGDLLTAIRLVVGSAWILFLVLGFTAIRRRDFAGHRVWMIRAYALAMGAGTQAVTQVPWIVAAGELDKLSNALALSAGWAINLAVAEWIIRRPARNPQPLEAR
jgi:cytochrome bd-type quinol oxidase subunit 2